LSQLALSGRAARTMPPFASTTLFGRFTEGQHQGESARPATAASASRIWRSSCQRAASSNGHVDLADPVRLRVSDQKLALVDPDGAPNGDEASREIPVVTCKPSSSPSRRPVEEQRAEVELVVRVELLRHLRISASSGSS